MAALSTTAEPECSRWRSETANPSSKRITLPRAGLDVSSNPIRRKVISASATTSNYYQDADSEGR